MTIPTQEEDDAKFAVQLTVVFLVAAVALNVAFFFLSGVYYDDKRASQGLLTTITASTVNGTRFSFGLFTGSVTLALIATSFVPKWASHGLVGVTAIASLIASAFAIRAGMPGALWMALLVIGVMLPFLIWQSLVKSRAAWSFMCAICYVLAVVLLFGAPKVRAQVGINLWTAMIIPGLLAVAAVGLTMIRRDYRDR